MLPEDTKELTFAELENFLKPNNISERFTLRAFLKLSKLIEQNFGITLKAQIPFFLIRSLSLPLQKSLEWLMQKNIIKEVRSLSNLFPDEPSFFNYLTEVIPEYKVWAGGVSETPDGALTKMIGEACERYAQTVIDPKKLTQAKFQDLKNAIDPRSFAGPSEKQRISNGWERWNIQDDSIFHWIAGKSLISGKKIFLPAQTAYFVYPYLADEQIILLPISTGAAAGLSENQAQLSGMCEVVERDAFMITYLNRLSPLQINMEESGETLKVFYEKFKKFRLDLSIYALPTDAPLWVMLAVITDTTGIGPAITVGAKAHPSALEAATSAALEAYYVRISARTTFKPDAGVERDYTKIKSPDDHAAFWANTSMVSGLDFLKNGKTIILPNEKKPEKLLDFFRRKNYEVAWVDLTSPDLKERGMYVGKAIIPTLQPLFMDESHPYYGGGRLSALPVELGYLKVAHSEGSFNKTPHPFP